MKQHFLLLALFCGSVSAFSQNSGYQKFHLSAKFGYEWPIGETGSVLEYSRSGMTLPAGSGFVPVLEAAYFWNKNYGIGLKYQFGKGNNLIKKDQSYKSEALEDWIEAGKFDIKESNHYIGIAAFGRWNLGNSNFSINANIGAGYLFDKLNNVSVEFNCFPKGGWDASRLYPSDDIYHKFGFAGYQGTTIGFSAAAGISYQLSSLISIGISVNELYGDISNMSLKGYDGLQLSRKINRIGITAGVNFSF